MSRADAARLTGVDRQTLRDWARRCNAHGPEGLAIRPSPGWRLRPSAEEQTQLAAWVHGGPDLETDGVARWRRKNLAAKIKREFDVDLAERSVGVPGAHAVTVCDGAGWHKEGDKLKPPDNVSPVLLPACAPELNPAENVWRHLRQNCLSNRVFGSHAAIVDVCCGAWNAFASTPDRIRSIAFRPWAMVNQ